MLDNIICIDWVGDIEVTEALEVLVITSYGRYLIDMSQASEQTRQVIYDFVEVT